MLYGTCTNNWIYPNRISFKEKLLLLFLKTYKTENSSKKYKVIIKYKKLKDKLVIVNEKSIKVG